MNRLAVLVDGSGFIYRAYYALPPFTNDKGQSVGAVYGFCSMLISMLRQHKSDVFCVVLDSGRDTFRSEIYPEYKSNRSASPEDLKSQIPMLKSVCGAFGVPTLAEKGFEADDIIAACATRLSGMGYDVRIISSDKDLMQLVDDRVSMFDPIKSKVIKAAEVTEKYGVPPSLMTFFQALTGDASDNIPGVDGVGPKTAAKLVNEFKTPEALYQNIDAAGSPRIRDNLINQRYRLELSLKLATLDRNMALGENLENLTVSYDYERAADFLKSSGFNSLIKRLDQPRESSERKTRLHRNVASARDLQNFFELNRVRRFGFFVSSLSDGNGVLALCADTQTACCIFSAADDDSDLFGGGMNRRDVCDALKPYLENPDIHKIGIRNDIRFFRNIKCESYDDLSVMTHLLRGVVGDQVGDIFVNCVDPICKLPFKNICEIDRVRRMSELIYDSFDEMRNELEIKGLLKIYMETDRPLIDVLKSMEENGICVSSRKLTDLADEFSEKIKEIEKRIFMLAGCEFNIGSVNQLADVLFSKLNIPKPKKKSLDVESLEELSVYSPVPMLVMEWRKLSKLLSGYTRSLCKLINPKTGRLHSVFGMTSAVTGRLSSSNPNLQTIPHRTEYGRRIREAFVSARGCSLISFDYSQIELRILAHMAEIESLRRAFADGQDIHSITAANVFGVRPEEVTKEMRFGAKAINFGIIYGMSPFRLSGILSVSVEQAREYIRRYFSLFPEFEAFKENTLEYARKFGFVKTLIGRPCYIKDIRSSNYFLRQFGERQAVNAVIQGSAADIIKIAMIKIFPRLEDLHSKILLQIHDELIFETENEFVRPLIAEVKNIMENAAELSVPPEVNVEFDVCLK
ncbi:MAG: DNA polymerase I [Holosporaceae bacterium]|jgi:DNA polymerase-1|nr:DNA polymerase I [Holosporaceae bacterium]